MKTTKVASFNVVKLAFTKTKAIKKITLLFKHCNVPTNTKPAPAITTNSRALAPVLRVASQLLSPY